LIDRYSQTLPPGSRLTAQFEPGVGPTAALSLSQAIDLINLVNSEWGVPNKGAMFLVEVVTLERFRSMLDPSGCPSSNSTDACDNMHAGDARFAPPSHPQLPSADTLRAAGPSAASARDEIRRSDHPADDPTALGSPRGDSRALFPSLAPAHSAREAFSGGRPPHSPVDVQQPEHRFTGLYCSSSSGSAGFQTAPYLAQPISGLLGKAVRRLAPIAIDAFGGAGARCLEADLLDVDAAGTTHTQPSGEHIPLQIVQVGRVSHIQCDLFCDPLQQVLFPPARPMFVEVNKF